MKAIIDDKIPYIRGVVERFVEDVIYMPGSKIAASDVRDADILMVRTRTRCDRRLLSGSRVRFIATATIGFDHIDVPYLEEEGIEWTNCPGCNATSVAQYVRNSLLLWERTTGKPLSGLTVGIVGVGHVGEAVRQALLPHGCTLLLNDPPRAEREGADGFVDIGEVLDKADVITMHTPLTREGRHATLHLVDDAFLNAAARHPLIINSSRGEVVDNKALLCAMEDGRVAQAIVDTWENEPHILPELLQRVFIGTPHIAGYSADGKANATRMALTALCQWLGKAPDFTIEPTPLPTGTVLPTDPTERALALYNPTNDSDRLKAAPEEFEHLRGNYPLRREFAV